MKLIRTHMLKVAPLETTAKRKKTTKDTTAVQELVANNNEIIVKELKICLKRLIG